MSEPAAELPLLSAPSGFEALLARDVLDALGEGFLFLDAQWRVGFINVIGERMVGRGHARLVGRSFWDAFPGTSDNSFGEHCRLAVTTREGVAFETYDAGLGGRVDVRAVPFADGLGIFFADVNDRRALQDADEARAQQLALLSEVSRELSSLLDAAQAVQHLAQLMVPTLADWCVVALVSDGATAATGTTGAAHRDPDRRADVEAYAAAHASPTCPVTDSAVLDLLQQLDTTSGVAVPLAARGSQLGALTLWNTGQRAPHTPQEVELALDIGRRAGLALENSRLYAGERRFSRALQNSLLTAPPTPPHCEIAVHYVPAAHEVQVGGDWYDAFCTSTGATVLAIGDVIGHDAQATATMGQVRGLLRGIGFTTGDAPAALVTRLDAAIDGLGLDAMATAVVARVHPGWDDLARGIVRMQWSNAGHLPPVVVGPDGTVQVLNGMDGVSDLLLGVDPSATRTEHATELLIGSTVLLYTDGLIERRGAHLDDSIAAFCAVLEDLGERPLQELCDEVLRCLVRGANEDDVALLAVRILP